MKTTEFLEAEIERARKLISQLNENQRHYETQIESMEKRILATETKAANFDIMMKAVKENQVVKEAWNKFMMALRLAGYDGS